MWIFSKKTTERRDLKIAAAMAFVGVVVVNALASLLPINGQTTGAISDSYPNLFVPAGVTFTIWSVIYTLLAIYVVYQFSSVRSRQSKVSENTLTEVNKYFIASSVINVMWILTWHYEILWLSVVLMLGLLASLIKVNLLLRDEKTSIKDRWFIPAPFSIYFGWITVATVANITTWLVSAEWDGFGLRPAVWMVAVLMVAAIIGITTMYRQRDWLYGSVIIWAFAGILLKHLSTDGWDGRYPSVIITLTILLAVLIIVVLYVAEKQSIALRSQK